MADMFLYILCEGELDEMFYEHIAERVTGKTFESPTDFRVRHGSNWKTAMAAARMLLATVKHWHGPQSVGVIIAVDNDRAPQHPGGSQPSRPLPPHDQNKKARHSALTTTIHHALGTNPSTWPVKVALAVPVEMIESWVLTLLNPSCAAALPLFSEASSAIARAFYGGAPPPQLKDLVQHETKQTNTEKMDLFWQASACDLAAASTASPSLKMFLDDLRTW